MCQAPKVQAEQKEAKVTREIKDPEEVMDQPAFLGDRVQRGMLAQMVHQDEGEILELLDYKDFLEIKE